LNNKEKETMKVFLVTLFTLFTFALIGCESSQPVDDTGITTKVKSKLAADSNTSAIKIGVETTNGVVVLTGDVPTQMEKSKAEEIAKSTEGVKSVNNQIMVKPDAVGATNAGEKAGEAASTAGEAVGDAAITAKIKAQYIAAGIIGTDVDTVNGQVTIKGSVDDAAEKANAEKIAKATDGVKGVKNQLTVEKKK
jgi:hyperosmotically inducible periplasmic protein